MTATTTEAAPKAAAKKPSAAKIAAAAAPKPAPKAPAKPRTPQYSWMDKAVPQAWIDNDPGYFARLDAQVRKIREADHLAEKAAAEQAKAEVEAEKE